MYSNRRREHVHIIRQFSFATGKYTGSRVVIFKKNGEKLIKDYGNFIKHRYTNPKSKVNKKSSWYIEESRVSHIIKKVMLNTNEERTLKMKHILYESVDLNIIKYYKEVLEMEGIPVDEEISKFICSHNK